jgi:hypothetical protein
MRPMWTAVVVALVLLTSAFLLVVPAQDRGMATPSHGSTGLRSAVTPSYFVSISFASTRSLPGYHDTLYYQVLNDTTGAPITTLSSIAITGTYYNTNLKVLPLPGTPINLTSPAPIGSWTFLVPVNSSTTTFDWPEITVWANDSSLSMNQSSTAAVETGHLGIIDDSVCGVVGTCGDLVTGNPATVTLTAEIVTGFGDSPAANETAKFIFYSTGSSPVTVAGVPASVTTNGAGVAAVTFTPLNTTFNVPGPDRIEVEVTDMENTSLTVYDNVTFFLFNPVGAANFAFYLDQELYYSGEQVVASWQWAGTNSSIGTINITNYQVYDAATGDLIANGLISSTSPTGSFHFDLPTTYAGNFEVFAFAHNSSDFFELEASATAYRMLFGIFPSEFYYNPGDTIIVAVTAQGPALTGATISAFVQASNSGQTLFNGTVSGSSFSFTIPKVAPADEYEIAAWASSPTAGTIASTAEYIDEASGFNFWAGVSTVSSYSDDSFAPGQTVQLSYAVTAFGTTAAPKVLIIEVLPGPCTIITCGTDTPAIKAWYVSGPTGSVSFTIPSGTPNGVQTFTVYGDWPAGDGLNQVEINVDSSPSPLNYELGAGSGLTVGWLILLILVIIVALVVLMLGRRGKQPSRMVMTPAASAAPEWKEAPSSGGTASGGSTTPPATPPPDSQ